MNTVKVTWLGQAGLLFECCKKRIIIDPYLSDSVGAIDEKKHRRAPVDERFLKINPDVIVLTHDHLDHTDPETLAHYLEEDTGVCVLASRNAWQRVRKFGGNNNYVCFDRRTEWTEGGVTFMAVKAEHSDDRAIGVIIKAGDKVYYVTGDTLYNEDIFGDLPTHIDYVFLPVNGVGNNMNFADGARFCERIGCTAIPMHCGLFDSLDMNDFPYENKIVPKIYKEIDLEV
ncbi:MAG: MBL fold metallo-hydrolase [Ruminococcaceae bacterium]|nr:MBL fold metallo-hydrolase [Oscillospiraceae bacterium]